MREIVAPSGPIDFGGAHHLVLKRAYWDCYARGVIDALRTLDVPIQPPERLLERFTLQWIFAVDGKDRSVTTGVCYADRGPVAAHWEEIDALFAMRWHPARHVPDAFPFPVYPAGFPLSLGKGTSRADKFLADELSGLRVMKDVGPQANSLFFNRYHFRVIPRRNVRGDDYPNRTKFFAGLARHPYLRVGFQPAQKWHEGIARHRATLNLCGMGNSIDRKVPIMCAIGTAIISDRGLADLALPNGGRFEHGRNMWFVDGPEDLSGAMAALRDEKTWRTLVDGSRELFDRSLSPAAMGAWYARCAREVVQ